MGSVTTVPVKLAPSPSPAAVIPCGNFPRHRSVHLLCRFPRVPPFPSLRREPITAKISEPRVLSAGQRRGSAESCRELPRAAESCREPPPALPCAPLPKLGAPARSLAGRRQLGLLSLTLEKRPCPRKRAPARRSCRRSSSGRGLLCGAFATPTAVTALSHFGVSVGRFSTIESQLRPPFDGTLFLTFP